MKEIEILYRSKDSLADIVKKIEKHNKNNNDIFIFKGTKATVDTYFESEKFNDLTPGSDGRLLSSLRLRDKDGIFYITHKKDIFNQDNIWLYSEELETEVGNIKMVDEILKKLHLKELLKINNTKTIYENSKYEISIEDVVDLGFFVEIEFKLNVEILKEKVFEIKNNIRELVLELDFCVGDEENAGKPELLLKQFQEK